MKRSSLSPVQSASSSESLHIQTWQPLKVGPWFLEADKPLRLYKSEEAKEVWEEERRFNTFTDQAAETLVLNHTYVPRGPDQRGHQSIDMEQ